MSRLLLCAGVWATGLLVLSSSSHAALIVAADNASNSPYNDGWQPGDNGGATGGPGYLGWGGGWTFRDGGNAVKNSGNGLGGSFFGAFVGSSLNNNSGGTDSNGDGDINSAGNKAWGMYANTSNELYAVRPLPSAMTVGQTLKWEFDNGNIDSTRVLGVRLLANANDISTRQMEVRFVGGDSNYTVIANPNVTTTHGFSREGISVEYTLTSATTYSMKITRKLTGVTQTITGANILPGGNQAINAIAFRNQAAGSGPEKDGFFNSISLTNANIASEVNDAEINDVLGGDPGNNPVTHTFTATNDDFDTLTWSNFDFDSYVPFYGGAGPGPALAASFTPGTQAFSWNTVGSPRGIYKWKVDVSDGEATDTGYLTIHVTAVPEPAAATLGALTLLGLAVARRRQED